MAVLEGTHRSALIEATVAEFVAAGYEGASLNRIIRAAGLSKSSFYHAVASKAELFDGVVEALVDDVRSRWTAPSPAEFASDDFWPRMDRMLGELAELAATSRSLGLLGRIFYLPAAPGDARSAVLDGVRGWVGEVLAAGVAARQVRADIPVDVLTAAAFGLLRGLDEWALAAPRELDAAGDPAPRGSDAAGDLASCELGGAGDPAPRIPHPGVYSPRPPLNAEAPPESSPCEGASTLRGGLGGPEAGPEAARVPALLLRSMLAVPR